MHHINELAPQSHATLHYSRTLCVAVLRLGVLRYKPFVWMDRRYMYIVNVMLFCSASQYSNACYNNEIKKQHLYNNASMQ